MLSGSPFKDVVEAIAFAGPISTNDQTEPGGDVVRRFRCRGYFGLTLMQWVMYDALGIPPAQLLQAIGGDHPAIPITPDRNTGRDRRRPPDKDSGS